VDHAELEVGGEVVDGRVAVRFILEDASPVDAVQTAHMMIGHLRPAPLDERAIVRSCAVLPYGDVRERPLEHPLLCGQLIRHPDERPLDQGGHVVPYEEIGQVGVAACGVQVHHLGSLHLEARASQHVHLHRRVRQMLRLAAVRGLHFDHRVPPGRPLQDIHPDVGLVRQEPGLIDRRRVALQGLARGRDLVVVLIVRQTDELASRDVAPGALADLSALREQVLLPRRGHELRRGGVVYPPPQLLVALQPGEVA
jgi:hypothetical protein